jgi:hypothetical protein
MWDSLWSAPLFLLILISWYVVPPHNINPQLESQQAFTGGLGGRASAIFKISANAEGTLQTPNIRVFEIGLPGLDFPGILAVGPTFSINANAAAELSIVADMSVGATIDLSQFQFTFPASEGKSTADVKPKDSRESTSIHFVHFSL